MPGGIYVFKNKDPILFSCGFMPVCDRFPGPCGDCAQVVRL